MVQGAGRREEIVKAAVGIAVTKGMGAVSVRSVATAAGVGASTLRHYFPSQSELHAEISRRIFSSLVTDDHMDDASASPRQRLQRSLEQFLPQSEEEAPAQTQAWFTLYTEVLGGAAGQSADQVEVVVRTSAGWGRGIVAGWLARLAEEGALLVDDVEAVVIGLLALLDGLMLSMAFDYEQTSLASAKRSLGVFVASLATDEG